MNWWNIIFLTEITLFEKEIWEYLVDLLEVDFSKNRMMKFLNKLFEPKPKENPFFTIFKQALPKGADFTESKIFHLKSFEYTDSNMELFENSIESTDFYNVLEKLQSNSQSNNVEIYYVINPEDKNVIYMLSDPFELFEKEYVMKEYKIVLDNSILSLSTVKQINP